MKLVNALALALCLGVLLAVALLPQRASCSLNADLTFDNFESSEVEKETPVFQDEKKDNIPDKEETDLREFGGLTFEGSLVDLDESLLLPPLCLFAFYAFIRYVLLEILYYCMSFL